MDGGTLQRTRCPGGPPTHGCMDEAMRKSGSLPALAPLQSRSSVPTAAPHLHRTVLLDNQITFKTPTKSQRYTEGGQPRVRLVLYYMDHQVFPASSPLCPGASSVFGGLLTCCCSKTGFCFMQFLFFVPASCCWEKCCCILRAHLLPRDGPLLEASFLGETWPRCTEPPAADLKPSSPLGHPCRGKPSTDGTCPELSCGISPCIVLFGTEHFQAGAASRAALVDAVGYLLHTT